MKRVLATLVLGLCLSGCISTGTLVTNEQASQFKKGETTESQVIAALGAPTVRTVKSDGDIELMYRHAQAYATPATYVPIVGLLAGGSKGTANVVTFKFDPSGKLISYEAAESAIDVHSGLMNQK